MVQTKRSFIIIEYFPSRLTVIPNHITHLKKCGFRFSDEARNSREHGCRYLNSQHSINDKLSRHSDESWSVIQGYDAHII